MNKARIAITVALALSSSIALADSFQFQKGFYIGANTGASFVTGQTYNELNLFPTFPGPFRGSKTIFRDEASARGYNGGVFLGWNFYVDREYFYGLEISANAYTNRAHQTFWSEGVQLTPTTPASLLNFEQSWDMRYSADVTFHPGVFVSESTALYAILGGSVGEVKSTLKRVSKTNPIILARQFGGWHEHANEESNTVYGFVLGAGVQKQLCNRLSMIASYQYTYYGDHKLRDRHVHIPVIPGIRGGSEGNVNGVQNRTITVDTNLFKIGLVYTF